MRLPPRAAPSSAPRRASWLPAGRELAAGDFRWRHRVVCGLLGLHVPALLVLAAVRDGFAVHAPAQTLPLLLLLGAALAPLPSRRLRAFAASMGLLTCSALVVHLFSGQVEAHFHYFVVVAVVALYQDWAIYALAIAFVAVQHGVMGALRPESVFPHGDPWVWALVHAAFILAESAVLILFWYASEQARSEEDRLRRALAEGTDSVQARLAHADRIRADLIATVSHEFRTPLTGIRAAALTLLKRGDRLDVDGRRRLLHAVLDQQERLSRLLENMLTAAEATAADPTAVAEVDAVAAEVAMLAVAARPAGGEVQVLVEPGTTARIDRQALHQVLANLVDNAQQHGSGGAVPIVAGGSDAAGVWITVSNDGSDLDPELTAKLFEPFTQADSGSTRHREGLGMGLYVVRRLVEVHGGRVGVRTDGGWVTVEVRLQAAHAYTAPPTALPIT
ncbi:MAG TPA: HAMP domain-containing sensor histidine kinase [Mycobacteriales bacterium]|nr:HAMP domain-containing sensor histidine kinase [Mycobacteriales bacterium]